MSDQDSEDDIPATPSREPVMVVEVSSNHSMSARTEEADEDEVDDATLNGSEESGIEHDSRPSSRRRKSRQKKTINGHKVDLTPPDKLLRKAEKRALRYAKENRADDTIQALIQCTAFARIVYGDNHWKHAETYAKLAEGYLELKNYFPQAQYHAENARNIMLSCGSLSESQTEKAKIYMVLLTLYLTLGRVYTVQKKYSEGETAMDKAEEICGKRGRLSCVSSDESDELEIKIKMAQGRLAAKQQKFAPAAAYFEKALELIERQHGSDCVELIPVYQNLGKVEQSKGGHSNHEKAIEMFLQAHSIAGANYSEGTLELADTAHTLAQAYSNTGEEDGETTAESYLNECLTTYLTIHGPNHEMTLGIQNEIAHVMARTDRPQEAISLLRSTIKPKGEVFGEYSGEIADTHKLIGSIHLSTGNQEAALKSFYKCKEMQRLVYGANHKKTKDTQKTIDMLLSNPALASRQPKSKTEEMTTRPRFNSIVNRSSANGGFKTTWT